MIFRRDAAASGLNDWSKMNLDLYNFHLHSPASYSLLQRPSSLSGFPQSSSGSLDSCRHTPFCHSWNEGKCQWPFGRCRFRHNCSNCEGEHTKADCPFPHSAEHCSHSPSPGGERGSTDGRSSLSVVPVHSVYNVIALPSQQKGLPQRAQLFCCSSFGFNASFIASLSSGFSYSCHFYPIFSSFQGLTITAGPIPSGVAPSSRRISCSICDFWHTGWFSDKI